MDINAEERRNIRILLRWIGGFMAWPGLSIAIVFLFDLEEHMGHFVLTLMAGLAGLAVFFAAPRLAVRFYPPDMVESSS